MFDRPRRHRRLRKRWGGAAPEQDAAAQEPWVALALDQLVQTALGPGDSVEPQRAPPSSPPAPRYPAALVVPIVLLAGTLALFVLQSSVRGFLSSSWIGQASIVSLERAALLSPGNPLLWLRLGQQYSRDGLSDEARESLARAVELAPSDGTARIELSLELERAGRLMDAERVLLDAASLDPGFGPRWSLANHYLRRADWEGGWRWANDAILAEPSRLPAVASLFWRANAPYSDILRRAIPDRADTNRSYFAYLSDLGLLDAMRDAWPRFTVDLELSDAPLATRYVDRLIFAGLTGEAVAAWNLLCDRLLLPHAPLGPDEPRFLTNPYFLTEPLGLGFDWRLQENRGVAWGRRTPSRGRGVLEFRLSGAQSANALLLEQILPVAPGNYLLEHEVATQGMPTRTGVGWIVRDTETGEPLRDFEILNNAEGFWDGVEIPFTVGAETRAASLELHYRDARAGERRRGAILFRDFELTLSPDEGVAVQ